MREILIICRPFRQQNWVKFMRRPLKISLEVFAEALDVAFRTRPKGERLLGAGPFEQVEKFDLQSSRSPA